MTEERKSEAFHFFLYLLHFLSMGFVVFGLGAILFQNINKYVVDVLAGPAGSVFYQSSVKFGIASLIVSGPIYFFTCKKISSYIDSGEIFMNSSVRKWLTYIVLFFAAATGIGDLIAVIFAFLEGDIVMRFFLKALVVLLLSGSVFAYYFWDLRNKRSDKNVAIMSHIITIVSVVFLCAVFISGFFIIDSPEVARLKKIDLQKVNDLSSLDSSVRSYFFQSNKLPETISSLDRSGLKPFTQGNVEDISYEIKGEREFLICATFQRSNLDDKDAVFGEISNEWKHGSGKVCFDRIVLESPEKKKLQ